MSQKDTRVEATVSGGTAQGIIGAGEVLVEHLVINNYAQPTPLPAASAQAEAGALPDNPYKGLAHFGPDDHALFFGRDKTIDKLVRAVDARSFNAILGPSGCGKSSLLLAGVAPKLYDTSQWVFSYFRISDSVENDPFLALAQALLPLYQPDLDDTDRLLQRRKLGAALRAGDIPFSDVFDAIRRNWPQRRLLLIADQFEELYTSGIDAEMQTRFMDFLIDATRMSTSSTPPGFSLAVTLRADFLGLASLHRPFADAIDASVHILGPMKADELRQAIAEPARQRGVTFDEGLVDTILADVGREPGNLPLLEFALTQMWNRQENRCLSLASYDAVGRVTGALTKHADEVFQALDPAGQRAARRVFTQLVKPGAGTEDTRRVARRDELDAIWPLVQRLAGPENRLVVTNATAAEGETAEVVHEALIKHWGTLRAWVAEDRALLTWLDAFRGALKTWLEHERGEDDLLRGAALSEAEEWRVERADALNQNEMEFIDASIEARDRLQTEEKARQQRELDAARALARRRSIIANGSAAVAIILALMGWFLFDALNSANEEFERAEDALEETELARDEAESARDYANLQVDKATQALNLAETQQQRADQARDQALITQSRFLADLSRQETRKGDAVTGMLLALEALPDEATQRQRPYVLEAETSLYEALYQRRELFTLSGHESPARSAAFSANGSRVVTIYENKTASLWDAQSGAEIAVLAGHTDRVTSAVFSVDGTRVVTASLDKTARLWDAQSGAEIAVLAGHEGKVRFGKFSADSSRLVTVSIDKTARLWDAHSGAEIAVLSGHKNWVTSAVFSADGSRVVTVSWDNTARVWDAQSGVEIDVLPHYDEISTAAFSADGSRLVTISWHNSRFQWVLRLWDLRSGYGRVRNGYGRVVLSHDRKGIRSAAFSADGSRLVTASEDKTARLWDAQSGAKIAVLAGHEGKVRFGKFSADSSRLVTVSIDKTARLWDAQSGAEIAVLTGHEDQVTSAAFSADGTRVVTASRDKTARLWDAQSGDEIAVLAGHESPARSARFSAEGSRVLTIYENKTVRVWDVQSGAEIVVLAGHEDQVTSAAFSADGSRVVTASDDKTARLWDAHSGAEIAVLSGHKDRVTSAAFSADGSRVVTVSWDKTARLWDAQSGDEIAMLAGHETRVYSAAFSANGSRVVTTSWDFTDDYTYYIVDNPVDKTARVWDVQSGAEIAVLAGHKKRVLSAAFSADGSRLVTASEDKTARVWDAQSGAEIAVLSGHIEEIYSAVFSVGGSRVVTASADNTARLWDAESGAEIAVLTGHEGEVYSAAFSADGTRVVTASEDNTARLWDAQSGAEIAVLSGHTNRVYSAAFSADGTRVVTASEDNTARLWGAYSGAEIAVLAGHESVVYSAAFSADGSHVVTASRDGTARLWPVFPDTQSLVTHASGIVPRRLTPEQRERFYLNRE